MNRDLAVFASQWLRIAVAALVPVVLTAFLTMPMNLGRHPGEALASNAPAAQHMT